MGYVHFSNFHNLADTLAALDDQIATFHAWSSLGRVNVITYNEICFDSASVVARIGAQIGVATTRPTC
jgi:hypothetical protein